MVHVGLLAIAAAIVPVLYVVARVLRKRAGADSEPACGQCGYLVRGLTSLTCPECGSDLREVGITRPGLTRSRWSAVHTLFPAHDLLVFGNLWLIVAGLLFVGAKVARTQPVMYSFFGVGQWLYPGTYRLMTGFAVVAAMLHFFLLFRKGR